MKKETKNKSIMCQPTPNLLVTCRDNKGNNNALAVGDINWSKIDLL